MNVCVAIILNSHGRQMSAPDHLEWIVSVNQDAGIVPYLVYSGSGIITKTWDTSDGSHTNNECELLIWVDENTRFRVTVWGQVRKRAAEAAGCTPPYSDRQAKMELFVKEEAARLTDLIYERLTGTDTIPPDTELVNKKEIAQDRLRYARDIRDDYEKHWNNVVLKEVTGGVFGDVNLFDAQYSASNPLKIPTLDDTLKGSFLTLDERA